jgi:hypothetical protein
VKSWLKSWDQELENHFCKGFLKAKMKPKRDWDLRFRSQDSEVEICGFRSWDFDVPLDVPPIVDYKCVVSDLDVAQ